RLRDDACGRWVRAVRLQRDHDASQRPALAAHQGPQFPRAPREAGTIMESRGWVNRTVGESGVDVSLRPHVALQLDRQLVEVAWVADKVPGTGFEGGHSLLRRRLLGREHKDRHAPADVR